MTISYSCQSWSNFESLKKDKLRDFTVSKMNASPEKIGWALSKYQFARRESPKLKSSVPKSGASQDLDRGTLSSRLSLKARLDSQDQSERNSAQLEGADKSGPDSENISANVNRDNQQESTESHMEDGAGQKRKKDSPSKTCSIGTAETSTCAVSQDQGSVSNFEGECVQEASETSTKDHDNTDLDNRTRSLSKRKSKDVINRESNRTEKTVGRKRTHSKHDEKNDELSERKGDLNDGDEDGELFRNSLGKQFKLNMTDEAKELVKELALAAKTEKPPTVARLKVFTNDTLETLLRYNDRPVYNNMTNAELAAMVLDYMKHGCPPRCPKCKRGALRFSNGKKKYGKRYYWCPGSTMNGHNFYGCGFKADRKDLTRTPWQCP